jgi:hypothetical protein
MKRRPQPAHRARSRYFGRKVAADSGFSETRVALPLLCSGLRWFPQADQGREDMSSISGTCRESIGVRLCEYGSRDG